jgi:hypothetical protein
MGQTLNQWVMGHLCSDFNATVPGSWDAKSAGYDRGPGPTGPGPHLRLSGTGGPGLAGPGDSLAALELRAAFF